MKIYLANSSKQIIGGGWTFIRNLRKGLEGKVEFVNNLKDCDIFFVSSATMVSRDEVMMVKEMGKKIVLRVDNIPRNSRNRNTGTSRLWDFAQAADLIIYQSNWAREFVGAFIDPEGKKKSAVIYNGADESIFTPDGPTIEKEGAPQYLYIRYNRDETKRWEEAWFEFQTAFFKNKNAHLWIVGCFSDELKEYNFDFFGGAEQRIRYMGIIEDPAEMAKIYRSADLLLIPYFNDACSNLLIEYLRCNREHAKIETGSGGLTGGTPEIINLFKNGYDFSAEKMAEQYFNEFKNLLS